MDQHSETCARAVAIAPGLLARKGEARPSLARGFEAAEYGLAYPLIARGHAEGAAPRIAHRSAPCACPHIARTGHARPAMPIEAGRKAAFTLRLDAGRHASLRDACVSTRRSAQVLVTQALDAFLADLRRTGAPLSVGG